MGNHEIINFDVQVFDNDFDSTVFDITKTNSGVVETQRMKVNVLGAYQAKNVATVLQTIEVLKKLPFFKKFDEPWWSVATKLGFEHLKFHTQFMGRWQIINQNPVVLCDSAHNEGGLSLAMVQLKALTFNKLHVVVGMVKDKDISKMLSLFPADATYYFCKANIPRGMDAEELKEKAKDFGLIGKAYPSVKRALAAAKKSAKADDLIYVGGSTFIVAEAL